MNKVILILGMHRSGTSALTRVISLLGASLPKSILGKNTSNLRGHWESELMIAAHENLLTEHGSSWKDWRRVLFNKKSPLKQQAWRDVFTETLASEYKEKDDVWVVKEPRICRFAGPYIETLQKEGCEIHSLIMVRNPLEVAASLESRDKLDKLDGLYLWLTHMLEAELATRGSSRSFISYDEFLTSPVDATGDLVNNIPFALPYKVSEVKKQIKSYVSSDLKRQISAVEDIVLDPIAGGWVSDAYEAFLVLCDNPESMGGLKKLDNVREGYFPVLESLYDVLTYERERLGRAYKHEISELHSLHERAFNAVESKQKEAWLKRNEAHMTSWAERDKGHVAALNALKESHAIEIAAREDVHNKAWAERDMAHDAALNALKENHAIEIAAREDVHKKAWAERDTAHEAALNALKENHESALMRLDGVHSTAWAEHDKAHETALIKLKESYAIEVAERYDVQSTAWTEHDKSHETALNELKENYAREVAERDDAHSKAWAERDKGHESALNELKESHATEIADTLEANAKALSERDTAHAGQVEALHAGLEDWEMRLKKTEQNHAAVLKTMNDEVSFMRDEFGVILDSAEARAASTASEVEGLRREMSAVLNSTSWKMTAGLRRVMNRLKGVKADDPAKRLNASTPPPRLEYKPDKPEH